MGSWGARFWTQNCDETLHDTCTSATQIPDMEGLRVSGWILVGKSLTNNCKPFQKLCIFFFNGKHMEQIHDHYQNLLIILKSIGFDFANLPGESSSLDSGNIDSLDLGPFTMAREPGRASEGREGPVPRSFRVNWGFASCRCCALPGTSWWCCGCPSWGAGSYRVSGSVFQPRQFQRR